VAYSQFHDGFWTDPEIRQLSSDDKMILIWFITNPARHYSGIYFFEIESISKQTGLPEKTVIKGIDTLSAIGFLKYNPKFSMVWVRKMARHEVVRSEKTGIYSDKQTKGIANHFEKLHKCPLIKDFLEQYSDMNIPYRYGIRQEEVEVEVKEETKTEEKDIAPPGEPVVALNFYSCQFFDVDLDYRMKLAKDFPALTDELLKEEFSKMEDWIIDNKSKKKFKSNGHLGNERSFIGNWLRKVVVDGGRVFAGGASQPGLAAFLARGKEKPHETRGS
jgi:hypothetical protein